MDILPKDVILEFHPDTFTEIRKSYGFDDPVKLSESVTALEEWINQHELFVKKDFSKQYLETTLISSKGSVERAKKRLANLFRLRSEQPQFFGNFDLRNDFRELDGIISVAVAPKLTKDHCRVLFVRNTGKTFKSNIMLQMMRKLTMLFEYIKIHDYSDGIILICDLREASLIEAIRNMSIFDLRLCAPILIEGYGARLKGLHVLQGSRIINVLLWIFKKVLSAKIIGRIHVHKNLKTLHDFVPKEILPAEYDGNERSLTRLNEEWLDVLSTPEFRRHIDEMSEARIDESRKTRNNLQDDFNSLNID